MGATWRHCPHNFLAVGAIARPPSPPWSRRLWRWLYRQVDEVLPKGLLWFPSASTRDAVTRTRCRDARLYNSWKRTVETPSSWPSARPAAAPAELQSTTESRNLDLPSSSLDNFTWPWPSWTTRLITGWHHREPHHFSSSSLSSSAVGVVGFRITQKFKLGCLTPDKS